MNTFDLPILDTPELQARFIRTSGTAIAGGYRAYVEAQTGHRFRECPVEQLLDCTKTLVRKTLTILVQGDLANIAEDSVNNYGKLLTSALKNHSDSGRIQIRTGMRLRTTKPVEAKKVSKGDSKTVRHWQWSVSNTSGGFRGVWLAIDEKERVPDALAMAPLPVIEGDHTDDESPQIKQDSARDLLAEDVGLLQTQRDHLKGEVLGLGAKIETLTSEKVDAERKAIDARAANDAIRAKLARVTRHNETRKRLAIVRAISKAIEISVLTDTLAQRPAARRTRKVSAS